MKWVLAVQTKAQLKAFIDFPHDLYKSDPCYVPELFIAQRDLLTPGKHPFHEHSKVKLYLAYNDNKVVGRIAAIHNVNHNAFNETSDGFFGFFDCINDAEVSRRLFQEAEQWLTAQGVKNIVGPANFSTNETCGLLIDGFDTPPFIMMPYNKAYYGSLLDQMGFRKKVDLIAYRFGHDGYDDKAVRLNGAIRERLKRKGITIRPVNKKDFDNEVARIREVYNSAWDKNLGFVPMTDSEFDYLAKDMKLILDTDFCMVAETEGKVIGFALALPDINQVLIKIRRGRLLPLGLFKLLLGLRKVNGIRVLALGVVEGYRKLGIESCFYADIIEAYRKRNFKYAEASWILEHNEMMNKAMEHTKGKAYKRYRIFEKAI